MGRGCRARVRCRFGSLALIIVAVPAVLLAGGTQGPSLSEVLVRATRYVEALHGQLSALVAEERWLDEMDALDGIGFGDGRHWELPRGQGSSTTEWSPSIKVMARGR